ncbi:endo-alpha-N-acetylgalactosaminidase family protein [uncultured Robinsoniella sp.]|uniref:InlB B-repeat-containing protein n=1 Tax=uncultured Robinsoniella sp. TaxID=904190 RepID=UPI00374EAEE1
MKKKRLWKRILPLILSTCMVVQPVLPVYAAGVERAADSADIAERVDEAPAKEKTGAVRSASNPGQVIQGETNDIYEKDFSKDGIEGFTVKSGSAALSKSDGKLQVPGGGTKLIIDENSPTLKNTEVEFEIDPANNNGRFYAVVRYAGPNSYTVIGNGGVGGNTSPWYLKTADGKEVSLLSGGPGTDGNLYGDGQRLYAKRVKPYKLRVRAVEKVVTVFLDDAEIFNGEVPGISMDAGKSGMYFENNGGGIHNFSVSSQNEIEPAAGDVTEKEIASGQMSVKVDRDFPRVISYSLNGKTMQGQEIPYDVVEVNNKAYVPSVTSEINGNRAVYHIEANGMTFDTVLTVRDNVMVMTLENIAEGIKTIYFPKHSLVSVNSSQEGAALTVNDNRVQKSVDLTANPAADPAYKEAVITVVNNNELAASVRNDSSKEYGAVAYQTVKNGDHYTTGLWTNEFLVRGLDDKDYEKPYTAVAITSDRNQDGKVDFQDGAIAYRDDCYADESDKEITGSEAVMNAYTSVAMNVGSAAQYPFLRILDNAKKFNLGTDGFQQMIIIKGYQGEGHDASHPDFANYNKRAGGLEDFNTLLSEGEKYNAYFGVHINHTEMYPEASQYAVDELNTGTGAWNWYDSAVNMIRENDILMDGTKIPGGNMEQRLQQLNEDTNGKLKLIYVDTYFDNRFAPYRLEKAINGLTEQGTAVATEYPEKMTTRSAWAHHINSTYAGAGNMVRFVYNGQRDIFGQTSLFRGEGSRVNGFNGWQGADDYYATMRDFFINVLPNRFLAQYPISQWTNNNKAVLGKNNEVVTEMKNGKNVISLNGHEVASGNNIFIPWTINGQEKIYHYNEAGGTTSWTLPQGFDYSNVKLYKLTSTGKTDEQILSVGADRTVAITADARQGYVIYPGDAAVEIPDMESYDWSTGSLVKDMGFDSHTFGNGWINLNENPKVTFTDTSIGNTMIRITGSEEGTIGQEMTGLTPGQSYSASAWIRTSEGRKVHLSIEDATGTKLAENYIDSSNVIYGVHHTDKYREYFQRVKLSFTVPQGQTTAEIKIKADTGSESAEVLIDDVRVIPITLTDQGEHYFFEDFENVDQEYGPFVSTESDQSHLSELNQVNAALTDDVIEGNYSLKIRNGDYMRTLSHRVRLKPNTTYTVGLDYKALSANAFALGVKSDKALALEDTKNAALVFKPLGGTGYDKKESTKVAFTTGDYDDYYIDLTKQSASEYIIDNFYVNEGKDGDIQEYTLSFAPGDGNVTGENPKEIKATEGLAVVLPENTYTRKDYDFIGWNDGEKTYEAGAVYSMPGKNVTLTAAWEEGGITYTQIPSSQLSAVAESQQNDTPGAPDGPGSNAVDGDTSTIWHSAYSSSSSTPMSDIANDRFNGITIDLGGIYEIGKLEYIPRQEGGKNGIITGYKLYYSESEEGTYEDGAFLEVPEGRGTWAGDASKKTAKFSMVKARRLMLRATSTLENSTFISASEFYVYQAQRNNYEYVKAEVKAASADSTQTGYPITNMLKDDNNIYHSDWSGGIDMAQGINNKLTFDFGETSKIGKLDYLPRQGGGNNGIITEFKLYYSTTADQDDWLEIPGGEITWAADTAKKTAVFTPTDARRIQMRVRHAMGNLADPADKFISGQYMAFYQAIDKEEPGDENLVITPSSCGCTFQDLVFADRKIVIPKNADQTTVELSAEGILLPCEEPGHAEENISYSFEIAEAVAGTTVSGNELRVGSTGIIKLRAIGEVNGAKAVRTSVFTIVKGEYTVTAQADPAEGGSVEGTTDVEANGTALLTAEANPGYIFDGWYLGEDKASDEPVFTTPQITADTTYVARFIRDLKDVTITVQTEDETAGSVSGGGTVKEGEKVTITARAKAGYTFEGWYLEGVKVSEEAEYEVEAAEDAVYTAKFIKNAPAKVTVTVQSEDEDAGTVSGGGVVNAGEKILISAQAKEGYTFEGWYLGETKVSDQPEYEVEATEDITYTARFKKIEAQQITITVEATEGGTAQGTATVDAGTMVTITAVPDEGYTFEGWYLNNVNISRNEVYEVEARENATYVAHFTKGEEPQPETVSITTEAQPGGTVSKGGVVMKGEMFTITAYPEEGFRFAGWYLGDKKVSDDLRMEVVAVEDAVYTAHFEAIPKEMITIQVQAETGGTVAGGAVVEAGSVVTIHASAQEGYEFAGWYIGDMKVSSQPVYTINALQNTLYLAKFVKKEAPKPQKVTVTVKAEKGGTATGTKTTESGSSVTITAKPSSKYTFQGWYLKGKKVSTSEKYTVTVYEDTVYTAKFKKITAPKKVTELKASMQTTSKIKLSWKKTSGARGYELSRYNSTKKKWSVVKTTGQTDITVKGLNSGTVYKYRVRAYSVSGSKKLYGKYSTVLKTATAPKKPVMSGKKISGTSVKLSWKKGTKADGFVVYMKTGKGGFTKIKTVSSETTSYTKKKLKKGKTYQFKIRGYKKAGRSKIYSNYSKTVTVKLHE